MKKILLPILAVAAVLLVSCDTKECRCYTLSGNRWVGPTTTYTVAGTPCASLNTGTDQCNEMDDPIIDPDDIAVGKKK